MSIVYLDDITCCRECASELGGSGSARGLCTRCYRRLFRAGTVEQYPLRPTRADEPRDVDAEHGRASAPFVPMPWVENALCAEVDTEIFFPQKGGSTAEAKSICAECLVAAECLEYALATGQRHGIWGGVPERKRRTLLGLPEDDDPEEASAA